MNRAISQALIFALLLLAVLSRAQTASAKGSIDMSPVIEAYERCVEGSDPDLAYRCAQTMDIIYGEFSWPSGGPDPRTGPVYVNEGVVVCSSVPSTLVLVAISPSTGRTLQLELPSPTACDGATTGSESPALPLTMDIYPHSDPMLGPAGIAFFGDDGIEFRIVTCMALAGNMTMFDPHTETGRIAALTYYAPTWCSATA